MNIAKLIDHTNIDIKAKAKDIKKTCAEAMQYGFRGVDVRPQWVSLVKKELQGTDIKVIVLIDPPMGLSSRQERIRACKKARADGADELDVVMNIVDLKYERYEKILKDPLERRELKEKAGHLKIMKKAAPGLLIKASAQIRTLEDVKKVAKAGTDIIGTSSGVKIMQK